MEDSSSKTVEFLRARLLSERSISRAAKQRADELAKRVTELEKQLRIVSLQRKKAEKATETVLAILENHGVGDASDDFDSVSDQGTALCESNVSDCKDEFKEEEASAERNLEMRGISGEAYSSSEVDSSLPFGRNLSWKSDRSTPHSLSRKKYMDSSRRSSSSASTASSSKVAKSCRRIRRRETISDVEESHNETTMQLMQATRDNSGITHAQNLHGVTRSGTESPRGDLTCHADNSHSEFPAFLILENENQEDNDNVSNHTHEDDKDMEKALQHQSELIGQYEAEERLQREWEEKHTEDSNFVPDSSRDIGNHSDVSEERDDIRAVSNDQSAKVTICSQDLQDHGRVDDEDSLSPASLLKTNCDNISVSQSSSPEFAFPTMPKENNPSKQTPSSSTLLKPNNTSGGKCELALVLPETNKNVRNVLEALEQAKFSLREELNITSQIQGGRPVGLFRLPTDINFESTPPRTGYSSPPLFSMAKRTPETASDIFSHGHFPETRRTDAWRLPMLEPFPNIPSSPARLLNSLDPRPTTGHTFPNNHTLFSPSRLSATVPVRENMFSPSMRFSPHDDRIGPHTYRY
ncbi:unnamed protein product [Cuscuta campestris]|uniref:Uncharacterized protein n=1 Tax=Cuscuta campestris TaxID=132261 RepID=A0A484KD86_9ASTE|nr:unnamed protein product [Cuscuta campestris]